MGLYLGVKTYDKLKQYRFLLKMTCKCTYLIKVISDCLSYSKKGDIFVVIDSAIIFKIVQKMKNIL